MRSPNEPAAEPLHLISLPNWLWIAVLMLSILSGITYGVLGVVTRVVEGVGVTRNQLEVLTVSAPQGGIVREVLVPRGSLVEPGTPIVALSSDVIETEIEEANELLELLESEHRVVLQREERLVAEASRRREAALSEFEETSQNAAGLLELRQELLASQEDLLERGLISQETVLATRTAVAALESRIVNARTAAASAQLEIAQLETTLASDRAARRRSRMSAASRVAALEQKYEQRFTVRSLLHGRVDEVFTQAGAAVDAGELLARLVANGDGGDGLRIAAVIPQSTGKELSVGDAVQVVPTFVDRSRYGFIRGKLTWITTYAAADAELQLGVTNSQQIERLQSEFGPLLVAEIELERDPKTRSGFAWSTEKGWPGPIGPGVPCSLEVIFRTDRPIELLFPWIRSLLGE